MLRQTTTWNGCARDGFIILPKNGMSFSQHNCGSIPQDAIPDVGVCRAGIPCDERSVEINDIHFELDVVAASVSAAPRVGEYARHD